MPNLAYCCQSSIIKKGKNFDPVTQENKAINIKLAASQISGIIINPGETFSFWKTVGTVNKNKGYKEGRVLRGNKMITGVGGGLCNLANTINYLILHSPLDITEFHTHSDALANDISHRKPMANGTSVSYNYIDYRFKNNTNQKMQIKLWCNKQELRGELRSEQPLPHEYKIIEKKSSFQKKENNKYYKISQIYQITVDKKTNRTINNKLIWNNHSEVMFDPNEIPNELITD